MRAWTVIYLYTSLNFQCTFIKVLGHINTFYIYCFSRALLRMFLLRRSLKVKVWCSTKSLIFEVMSWVMQCALHAHTAKLMLHGINKPCMVGETISKWIMPYAYERYMYKSLGSPWPKHIIGQVAFTLQTIQIMWRWTIFFHGFVLNSLLQTLRDAATTTTFLPSLVSFTHVNMYIQRILMWYIYWTFWHSKWSTFCCKMFWSRGSYLVAMNNGREAQACIVNPGGGANHGTSASKSLFNTGPEKGSEGCNIDKRMC